MAHRNTRHHPTVKCSARLAATTPATTKRWEFVNCGTCKRARKAQVTCSD